MMKIINKSYIGLGSNLGNKNDNLHNARILISKHLGDIIKESSIIKTKAWGNTQQDDFLNQVLLVATSLNAFELLQKIHEIEFEMGRIRTIHWGPRVIDIDILLFNNEIIETDNLKVPHPYLHERAFVLESMNEIAPDLIHPILAKSIQQLLKELPT